MLVGPNFHGSAYIQVVGSETRNGGQVAKTNQRVPNLSIDFESS